MSERLKRFFSHGGTIAFITGFFSVYCGCAADSYK